MRRKAPVAEIKPHLAIAALITNLQTRRRGYPAWPRYPRGMGGSPSLLPPMSGTIGVYAAFPWRQLGEQSVFGPFSLCSPRHAWTPLIPQFAALSPPNQSIKSLTLESVSDIWAETFLDRLASDGAHLSYLSLGNCNPLLSKSIAFQTLRVLELRGMDKDITAAHLTEVGWDGVELTSVARQDLFRTLTDLKINATPARLYRNIPDLLSVASSREMQSFSIGTSIGERWEATTHSAAILSAIYALHCGTLGYTLRHLDIHRIAGSPDDLAPLEEVTGLWKLTVRVPRRMLCFCDCLAEHCPALRTLRVAYTVAPPPPLDVTAPMTPHLLEELWFVLPGRGDIWNRTKITRLAQYFDHFFPHLVLIRGEGHMWWEEVEQLVFEYQDRRHTNSQKLM
ncbi:hypothetical protein B0H14DRAFT_2631149 [Mycena olivaceomarginata]|nr:hypothetical protein B0H14DRAFT_2631149 [Mycena olivaceomarginata]